MRNMTIAGRLALGFGLIILLTAVFGGIAIYEQNQLAELTELMHRHPLTVTDAVLSIKAELVGIHRSMKDVALTTSETDVNEAVQRVKDAEERVYQRLETVKERFLGDISDVEEVERLFIEWAPIRARVIALTREGNTRAAAAITRGEGADHLANLNRSVDGLVNFARGKSDAFLGDAIATRRTSALVVCGLLGIVLLLGVTLAVAITRGITGPLGELTAVAVSTAEGDIDQTVEYSARNEIGTLADGFRSSSAFLRDVGEKAGAVARGDFSVEIVPRGDRDSLGKALGQMVRSLREATHERETQDWLKAGAAGLAEHLQGEQDVATLAHSVITFLARYLDAQMASLYLADESGESLMLTGSYAFHKRKSLNDTIKVGEGLAGQAAREKGVISVTEVPEDYVRINSTLGDTPPRNVLAAAFTHERRLVGVVEFATVREFSDLEMAFLTNVLDSIAVAFTVGQSRARLSELLEQSQRQAEQLQTQATELASQQEELRLTNEQLEQQSEEVRAANEELEQQSEELRASNEELEEKTRALERQKGEIDERRMEVERAKREIESKAHELELASTYKSEFLANMSHELRTPLNSLLILAKLLSTNEEGNLTDGQAESARVIHDSGQQLLFLINEILDLSKVEAGMMEIHPEEVALADVADRIQRQFGAQAEKKQLDLAVRLAEDAPPVLHTDPQRMEQILRNLLSNALKFTAEGSVTLTVGRPHNKTRFVSEHLTPSNTVALSVQDTGPGIPDDKQAAIFEAFQQADGSTSRQYGGTGLGLSISRALAHLLNGELQLESTVGQGSTFTLYLPLERRKPVPKDMAGSKPEEQRPHRRAVHRAEPGTPKRKVRQFLPDDRESVKEGEKSVLVIEDDPEFSKILMGQARQRGFKCLAAGDGGSGLTLAAEYEPSAIILDLGLPDIDGATILDSLKYDLATRHIPVHIMSGRDMTADILQKGAVGYLTKPITPEDIEASFGQIEALLDTAVRRVLIVEDDEAARNAVAALVESEAVEITGAATGGEAHALIAENQYHCVILDLGLPDMTGFELLRTLDEDGRIDMPPVIVYTGKELTPGELRDLSRYTANIVIKNAGSPERLLDETSLFLHTVEESLPQEQKDILRMLHDPDKVLQGRKVLLVDDDLRNSFALSKALREQGLEVVIADNGELALDKLDECGDIDLLLMDIMMPVMDGYEAMRRIRSQPRFRDLPIIALTAKAMVEDRAKCIEAGANDYLAKPIDMDKLLSLMRVLLFR